MSFLLPASLDENTRHFCENATNNLRLPQSLMWAYDKLYLVAKAILEQPNDAKIQRNFTAQAIVETAQTLLPDDKKNEITALAQKVAFSSQSHRTDVQVPQDIERLSNALKEDRQELIDPCLAAIKPETGFEICRNAQGGYTVKVNAFENLEGITASLSLLAKGLPKLTIDLVMPRTYVQEEDTIREIFYHVLLNNFVAIASQFKERVTCVDLTDLPQYILTDELLLQLTKDLSHLKHLSIRGTRLTDRSLVFLSQLTDLETLSIESNERIEEIPGLCALTNLRTLKLNACRGVKKMPDLINNTKLKFLVFDVSDKLREYPALSHLKDLETLHIYGREEFPDLSMLPGLKELHLHHGLKPEQLRHLRKLTKLETLVIWCWWDLTELTDISTLTNLRHLTIINHFSLTKIPRLSTFVKLQSLKINCDTITELPDLSPLTELIDLDLQGCYKLKRVNLAGLTKIQSLNLVACGHLQKLPSLSLLLDLRTLRLRHFSFISTVTIADLPQLETLECSWNAVTQMTLKGLPRLRSLDIRCARLLKSVSLQNVDALETLDLRYCFNLARFNATGNFPKLRTLIGFDSAVARDFWQTNQQSGELQLKLSKKSFSTWCEGRN